jgi:hypothetical protein
VLDDFDRQIDRRINNNLMLKKKLLTVQRFWNNLNTTDFIGRQQTFILAVACWPLEPKVAGSDFSGRKKSSARLPSEG